MPGLLALAVAMGIGRFAFTPVLPMMQAEAGISAAQGGWLAAANYAGYLVGALLGLAMRAPPGRVIRTGLAGVVVTTIAMGVADRFGVWIVLRFAAGVASAWVLVFVSSWGFEPVEVVFAGVGAGIAAAGALCLALIALQASPEQAWVGLGLVALLVCGFIWPAFRGAETRVPGARPVHHWTAESIRLVLCYGAFGFGYIIPATFLPAMAKQAIGDSAMFGWAWPVFGLAAAGSTLAVGAIRKRVSDRALWMAGHLLMATGVLLLLPWIPAGAGMTAPGMTVAGVTLAALFVGGTFMVITMAGIQEARRVDGPGVRTLVAAMTSAFAIGQIAGPLVVSLANGFALPLAAAAGVLVASAFILGRSP